MSTPPSRPPAQERIESPPDVRGWSVIDEAQPRSYSQKHRTNPPRERSRVYARSPPEGVALMALKTPEEFRQSIANLHLQIYMFGEKIEDYVDHPVIRPSINCIAMTYELSLIH